jgi:excisionase family DNA binding protein
MMTQPRQPTGTPTDTVLDVRAAAVWLKVHPDTVYALIRSGRLAAKRLGKQRALRISVRALEAFLADPEA